MRHRLEEKSGNDFGVSSKTYQIPINSNFFNLNIVALSILKFKVGHNYLIFKTTRAKKAKRPKGPKEPKNLKMESSKH